MWRRLLQALLGVSLTACAAAAPARPIIGHAGREVLTAAEIVASKVTDAYQAVSQLRPEFLRRRATMIARPGYDVAQIVVYLDDLQFGGAESLHGIPLDRVRTIRYVSPIDADLRWGGSHPAGAILVSTMR